MVIKNLANYRVGKTYIFDVDHHGLQSVTLLVKAKKKLYLKLNDGTEAWFGSEVLSCPASKTVGNFGVPTPTKNQQKVAAKNTKSTPRNKSKSEPLENNEYWGIQYATFLKYLKGKLYQKGYRECLVCKPKALLQLIDEIVPEKENKEEW